MHNSVYLKCLESDLTIYFGKRGGRNSKSTPEKKP